MSAVSSTVRAGLGMSGLVIITIYRVYGLEETGVSLGKHYRRSAIGSPARHRC